MRTTRLTALAGVLALGISALGGTAPAGAHPHTRAAVASADSSTGYIVLAADGTSTAALADQLRAAGATVTTVNDAVGMVVVGAAPAGFLDTARAMTGVAAAGPNGVVGQAPKDTAPVDEVTKENRTAAGPAAAAPEAKKGPSVGADPFDSQLWDMAMMKVPQAHQVTLGDKRVLVGVLDTGIDGTHPDLAPNFDTTLSRNFTTDLPDIDGPCETASCVDPANVDDNEHGTHVAGTIAASLNGMGMSGVAPQVSVVNIRGGQDSGYFFLGPVVNAITYAGDVGIDVVNMSFYVDPWLYNCIGGAPEDSPEQAADQEAIILGMTRALNYAHQKNVTLVAALGNNHEDLSNPRTDTSSPDYGTDPYDRTISNATCFDLPVEGPHVIGVSAVGPSGTKADYSNYATDLGSGELELAAPGGWFRDGYGTPTYRTNGNLILSAAPLTVLQEAEAVDADGNITPSGVAAGVQKACTDKPVKGAAACGYYQWLQGTSMAAPHVAGVAALIVSQRGQVKGRAGFSLEPDEVADVLRDTAADHACPAGGLQSYTREGRSTEFDAWCVGNAEQNSLYGWGIADAFKAAKKR